jgi:hypothetical protein
MKTTIFEAKVRDTKDPKEAILSGLDIDPEIVSRLEYDEAFGGLVQKSDDGIRFVMFRAHKPVEQDTGELGVGELINRGMDEVSVHNSIYGTGLYMGNSREAVGLFSYKAGLTKEIGVYLTSPYPEKDILDVRNRVKTSKRLRKLVGRQVLIQAGFSGRIMSETNSRYVDKKVVIMDKGPDTLVAQNIQVRDNAYPVPPVWFLLRDEAIRLQKVATSNSIEPRPYIKRLKGKKS